MRKLEEGHNGQKIVPRKKVQTIEPDYLMRRKGF